MSKADPSRSGSLVTKVHPVLSSYWAELEDRPYPPILPPPGGLPIHDLTGRITSQTVDLGTQGQVGRGRRGGTAVTKCLPCTASAADGIPKATGATAVGLWVADPSVARDLLADASLRLPLGRSQMRIPPGVGSGQGPPHLGSDSGEVCSQMRPESA